MSLRQGRLTRPHSAFLHCTSLVNVRPSYDLSDYTPCLLDCTLLINLYPVCKSDRKNRVYIYSAAYLPLTIIFNRYIY